MKKSQLNRQLLRAVKNNSCDMIDPLLRHGADPLANNCRALDVAIAHGRIQVLEKFGRHGVNFNQPQIYPVSTAVRGNQLETLRYVINSFHLSPDDLETACLLTIGNDSAETLALLLAKNFKNDFDPLLEECVENDSVNCFQLLVKQGVNAQIQAAHIVENCIKHSAVKILKYMLENFPPDSQALNSLLKQAACRNSTDVLEIFIKHGAIGPDESTEAFIEVLNIGDWSKAARIDAAELLLPFVNIARIDDRDLVNLACRCAWDLAKQVLKRGFVRQAYELPPEYAIDFVSQIGPEDYFVFEEGLPMTAEFLNERLGFCRELAKAAERYVKNYEEDDIKKKAEIAYWLGRIVLIKSRIDYAAWKARQLQLKSNPGVCTN